MLEYNTIVSIQQGCLGNGNSYGNGNSHGNGNRIYPMGIPTDFPMGIPIWES